MCRLDDAAKRASGFIEVLYRLTDKEIRNDSDIKWDDYYSVWPVLPLAEFDSPVDLLEQMTQPIPAYGELPRPPRPMDIIHVCPRSDILPGLVNTMLMVVDLASDCLPHLQHPNSGIMYPEEDSDLRLGLLLLKPTMKPFRDYHKNAN